MHAVIPAKAGIYCRFLHQGNMDSRFRGNDGIVVTVYVSETWGTCEVTPIRAA